MGRGEVQLRTRVVDDWLRIEVQDSGSGVSELLAPKILGGFYSTKGSSGTGVGLLVTRRIAEGHDGSSFFRTSTEEVASSRSPSHWSGETSSIGSLSQRKEELERFTTRPANCPPWSAMTL